ncbi:MAG: hypothetical protein ACRDRV_15920 [Pseudonocardiaceae bacterium]
MSNSTDPTTATAADFPHALQSDLRFCEVTKGDVAHHSTPVRVETVSAAYLVHLIGYDELAFPDEWDRRPSLRLCAESHDEAMPNTGGREPVRLGADVTLDEVLPLLGALAAQFALAGGCVMTRPTPVPATSPMSVVLTGTGACFGPGGDPDRGQRRRGRRGHRLDARVGRRRDAAPVPGEPSRASPSTGRSPAGPGPGFIPSG